MPLTRIDSAFLDLDAIGGIDFDVQSGVPTFSVDATTHRVGIGTDSPPDKLSIVAAPESVALGVKDSTRNNHVLQLLVDSSRGNGKIKLYQHASSGTHAQTVEIATLGPSYFNGGNVGIGTDNPNKILTVRGSSTPEILNKPIDATPAFFVGDSNRTSAGQHLTEYRGYWNGTNVARIVFAAGDDTTNKDDGIITMHTTPSGGNSTERLRITSGGIVLINAVNVSTSRLNAPLQIETGSSGNALNLRARSSDDIYSYLNFQNNAGSQTAAHIYSQRNVSNNAGTLVFGTAAANVSNSTDKFYLTSTGNVGIGQASPQSKLQIENAGEQLRLTYPSIASYIHEVKSNGDYAIDKDGAERFRITSVGYVGINLSSNVSGNATTTPWTNLHVVGANVADGVSSRNNSAPTGQLHVSSTGHGIDQGGTISLGSEADNVNPNAAYASISGRRVSALGYQYGGYLTLNVSDGSTLDEKLRITSDGQLLHTRNDNTTRYDLEFRNTGGISDGNYSGIHWTQSATGSTNLAAIEIAYADTGRPDIVFKTRQSSGTAISEAFRIASTGSVGIGTDTPESDQLLTIHGTSNYKAGIRLRQSSANIFTLQAEGGTGHVYYDIFGVTGPLLGDHIFRVKTGQEKFRIKSDGNVGIGTNNPIAKLHLNNAANSILGRFDSNNKRCIDLVSNDSGGHAEIRAYRNTASGTHEQTILIDSNGASYLQGGNVGIGTNNPNKLLHISSSSAPTIKIENTSNAYVGSLVGSLKFEGQDNNAAGVRAKIDAEYRGVGAATAIRMYTAWENETTLYEAAYFTKPTVSFSTNNSTRLVINSSGNVGIGTGSPGARLEVRSSGTNAVSGTLFGGGFTQGITAGEPQVCFISSIDNTGNPSGTEAARGGIGFSWANASDRTRFIVGTNSNHPVRFYTNAGEKMRISASGNVGIGTNNPLAKLHINDGEVVAGKADTNNSNLYGLLGTRALGSGLGGYGIDFRPGYENPIIWGYNNGLSDGIMRFSSMGSGDRTLGSGLTDRMVIRMSDGNVGIGTSSPGYKLEVNGSFAATTKSFIIDHPTKPGMKLRHGSLEGPENGVYVRGRGKDSVIELPEYWTELVNPDSITVSLTPIGPSGAPRVERIENNKVYVFSEDSRSLDYFYMINAERIDVDSLEVEIPE